MSMQLRIVHTTGFEYAGKATASFNEARLTPQTTPGQIVVHTRLEVHPTPWTYTYRDYWGTAGDRVRGARPARVADRVGDGDGAHRPRRARSPQLSWDDVREPVTADRFTEHLGLPSRVAPPEELADAVLGIAEQSDRPGTRRGRSARSSTGRSSTSPAPPT